MPVQVNGQARRGIHFRVGGSRAVAGESGRAVSGHSADIEALGVDPANPAVAVLGEVDVAGGVYRQREGRDQIGAGGVPAIAGETDAAVAGDKVDVAIGGDLADVRVLRIRDVDVAGDRKSTRLNSSHLGIS